MKRHVQWGHEDVSYERKPLVPEMEATLTKNGDRQAMVLEIRMNDATLHVLRFVICDEARLLSDEPGVFLLDIARCADGCEWLRESRCICRRQAKG